MNVVDESRETAGLVIVVDAPLSYVNPFPKAGTIAIEPQRRDGEA